MQHDLRLCGYAFALRPVTLEDAPFIVAVRTSDPQRVRYLHPISSDVEQQRTWLNRYFERTDDYYWVVERMNTKEREGLVGIYGMDLKCRTAEWGRWVLRPGSLAAVESAWLIYRVAFEQMKLDSLYCLTVADNSPVLSFHDSCGLCRTGLLPGHFQLGDRRHDGVKHVCSRQNWPVVGQRLESHARAIARRFQPPA